MGEPKKILLEVGDKLISNKGDVLVIERVTKTKAVSGSHHIMRACWHSDFRSDRWEQYGKKDYGCFFSQPTTYERWTQKAQDSLDLSHMRDWVASVSLKKVSDKAVGKIFEILQEEGE